MFCKFKREQIYKSPVTTETAAIRSVSEEVENDDFEESFDVTENFDTDAELFGLFIS